MVKESKIKSDSDLGTPYFVGSKKDFNRFLSGYSRNLVQRITRKYKKAAPNPVKR